MATTSIGSSGITYPNGATNGGYINSSTAVAATSGTSITFTGIPSWAKRITVCLDSVKMSGGSALLVRLGTSGGIVSTGYSSSSFTNTVRVYNSTAFTLDNGNSAFVRSGLLIITYLGNNIWDASGTWGCQPDQDISWYGGGVTLSGAVTQLQIIANGTDTFSTGNVNILWE